MQAVALTQGRYEWWHYKMLVSLANTLEQKRPKKWQNTNCQIVGKREKSSTTECTNNQPKAVMGYDGGHR